MRYLIENDQGFGDKFSDSRTSVFSNVVDIRDVN